MFTASRGQSMKERGLSIGSKNVVIGTRSLGIGRQSGATSPMLLARSAT